MIYPKFQDVSLWSGSDENKATLLTWLTQNFPPQNYQNNQKVKIYVMTYQDVTFRFSFSRSYKESCGPNVSGANTVACGQCPDNRPYQQCNITGHGCANAWSYCVPITAPLTKTYKCTGTGGRLLVVTLPADTLHDKHFANTVEYNFKLQNDGENFNWEITR